MKLKITDAVTLNPGSLGATAMALTLAVVLGGAVSGGAGETPALPAVFSERPT